MANVEERLTALEKAVEDMKCQLNGKPRTWLDDVAGSMSQFPDFDEVLRLGREYRKSVVDPPDIEPKAS